MPECSSYRRSAAHASDTSGASMATLEALRLEDPAAMSGCWNPGCAAGLALAGCRRSLMTAYICMHLDHRPMQAYICAA